MKTVRRRRSLRVPIRYIPTSLSRKDTKKQAMMLKKSRRDYKRGIYTSRKKVASFRSKKSKHILRAERIYGIPNLKINADLVKKTGCSRAALEKIVSKGEGAYFSSGSRPNQTAQSWGIARLASAITSGKASSVDYSILESGCKPNSKALRMAQKVKLRRTRKRSI